MVQLETVMLISIILILVAYKYFSLKLEENYNIYKYGTVDSKKKYKGVIIHIEKEGVVEYTNISQEVLKFLEEKKNQERIFIPNYGYFTLNINTTKDGKVITGIPY